MATESIMVQMPTGKTSHTADLFPRGSDTAAQTGLTVTEETNRKTLYTVDVTTGETGDHQLIVKDSSGSAVGSFWGNLNGTAREVEFGDDPLLLDLTTIASDVVASILAQSDAIAASLTGANNIERREGDTWTIEFTLTGDHTSDDDIWFSIKDSPTDSEDDAQVRVSSTVGLERIVKGTVAASSLLASNASISTSYDGGDDETTVTVVVDAAATALVEADNTNENLNQDIYPQPRTVSSLKIIASDFYWDLQTKDSTNGVVTQQAGQFRNRADVSKATS